MSKLMETEKFLMSDDTSSDAEPTDADVEL